MSEPAPAARALSSSSRSIPIASASPMPSAGPTSSSANAAPPLSASPGPQAGNPPDHLQAFLPFEPTIRLLNRRRSSGGEARFGSVPASPAGQIAMIMPAPASVVSIPEAPASSGYRAREGSLPGVTVDGVARLAPGHDSRHCERQKAWASVTAEWTAPAVERADPDH